MAKSPRASDPTEIEVPALMLDEENPRLPEPLPQDDIIASLAAEKETITLATHIAQHGVSPLDLIAVSPAGKNHPDRYVVQEGNRRTVALKLLDNPTLARTAALTDRYSKLVRGAAVKPRKKVWCAIFPNPKDAVEWVRLRHSGRQGGAGVLPWESMEQARYAIRHGNSTQYQTAFRFIEHAIGSKWIDKSDAANVNLSSLARVLNDSLVRARLHGTQSADEGLTFDLDDAVKAKLAKRLVTDWSEGGMAVESIYDQGKRVEYINGVADDLNIPAPSPEAKGNAKNGAGGSGSAKPKGSTSPARRSGRKKRHRKGPRKTIIPSDFHIDAIDQDRVADILDEMQNLEVALFPNAGAVLFRTLLDLSVTRYRKAHKPTVKTRSRSGTPAFTEFALACVNHIEEKHPETKAGLKVVRQSLNNPDGTFSIAVLHEYVHNGQYHPVPGDLMKHWDNFAEFIRLLWT
jgi:hypothetical protein